MEKLAQPKKQSKYARLLNPSEEFKVVLEEEIEEDYLNRLRHNKVYFAQGLLNEKQKYIITNSYDYRTCLDILKEVRGQG